jgi:predicted phosphoribosyltransferase
MFRDRKDAGVRLANALEKYRGQEVIVFALPRGGVVLGAEIALKLSAPLDLVLAKKIGYPYNRNTPSAQSPKRESRFAINLR